MAVFPNFFDNNDYFIDERVGMFKFNNSYKVYDNTGAQIGNVQQSMPGALKALSMVLNKGLFPFKLDIKDMDNNVLASIKRGWTFFMSKITITDNTDSTIGFIKQKFKLVKPSFDILDNNQNIIATISGDWKAWNFKIKDTTDTQLGAISKKWNGVLKEAFTTADKYVISILPEVKEDTKKIAIVSAAITIDMVLKENK